MSLRDTPDPSTMSISSSGTATNTASSSSVASTPSPSMSSAVTTPSASAARRPPRKSTLTQQQKNNKRQRATQDQLVTLEVEFNKNPTPTAATRERIAQEINMTERSVQIWFQNRRAKIKMLAKKSIETGEGCDSIPESMRQYLAMQFDPTKAGVRDPFGRTGGYGATGAYLSESAPSGKVVIHHFTCRSLTIGSWRRIGQNAMDLVVFYSPEKACMTYYINNDSAGYKIEYPFSHIKNITLESGEHNPSSTGAPPRPAGLVVELNRPPLFYMDSSNSGGFYQCGDFTEDQQASQIMVHHLGGHPKVLSVQLAKLVSLESFQNRLAYNNLAMAPPMSPQFIQRPASQPNQFAPAFLNMYQDHSALTVPVNRGHKRQRSRSVPVAVDFSAMQMSPFPSYNLSQTSAPFHNADTNIFAPIPQSAHPIAMNLRIDTSASYGFDPRGHPMSAATTTSPSDFASPSLFTTCATGESTPVAANMGPSFTLPYVSSAMDSSHLAGHTASPYSTVSHADPMIAEHSPPLSNLAHTPQDMYGLGSEQQGNFTDDGMVMNGMFSKQGMSYSVPTTINLEGDTFDLPMQTLSGQASPLLSSDYSGMKGVDPNALAPGS
ncbi:homeobox domain-containing protein [Aspergillus clavatus NRRL 1]|uniref:Homeobox domain protein n=1 Tax=Aspergillus clavatus (strain ATCC 1007 / CBS 513.65 / DSM 816 / NCTC 3887 / NRRL 1 / QM 1276 / 107) TaxID=344612 RepID=A1CHW7_ASPCL|nr:Homeobox domain protein [Aspergillus clavatus NRRL 1]EAW10472.1 Homeobox domain protein [Aspergillus clavatus NRRL 1]